MFISPAQFTPLTKQLSIIRKPMYVNKDGDIIRIAFKYKAARTDMWLEFSRGGANSLLGIGKWYIHAFHEPQVNRDLSRTMAQLTDSVTDWVGPYYLKANQNGNANAQAFTGGWHGYNGDATGTATARMVSYTVKADGADVPDGKTIGCGKVVITVINNIQGYNTKEQDGSGREILQETVTCTIENGTITVDWEGTALESLTIEKYYGLQAYLGGRNAQIYYDGGDSSTWKSASSTPSNCGVKSSYPNVSRFNARSSNGDNLICWIDRGVGLGDFACLLDSNPICFTSNLNKTYFNLINGVNKTLTAGEKITWRGGYTPNYGNPLIN